MSDLISRQAAINAFYQYPNINWTTLDVMEKISEVSPAQPEHNWIPYQEQKPPRKGYYLTCDKKGVTITEWNGKGWIRTAVIYVTEFGRRVETEEPILAWMPLPKRYEVNE